VVILHTETCKKKEKLEKIYIHIISENMYDVRVRFDSYDKGKRLSLKNLKKKQKKTEKEWLSIVNSAEKVK
jgi:hypothetical protein